MSQKFFNNANVIFLENEDFTPQGDLVLNEPVLVMIMSSGCPHCHDAAPYYSQLSDSMKAQGIVFAAILTDGSASEQMLSSRLSSFVPNLVGVPTLTLFRNGKYIKTFQGNKKDTGQIQQFISSA